MKTSECKAVSCVCGVIYKTEPRDFFKGETYCPACVTRASKDRQYRSVKEARKAFPNSRVLNI